MTSRIDPNAVRRVLKEEGLRARHALSQNFLADVDVLDAILDQATPVPGRRVLEVGPGLGILTAGLLEAGAAVTAVELDSRLAARLRRVHEDAIARAATAPAATGGLTLVAGDILDVVIPSLVTPPYDVVANLPYHITSPVLHRFLGGGIPRPDRLVLMVQREVAERIAAPPGKLSYLSVFVQYHAAVRIAFLVPPGAFVPEPAVWSAVIVVEPYPADGPDRLDPTAEEGLWRLVQAAFRERRKMLHNVLVRQLPVPGDRIERALAAVGIAGDRRPQTVSVGEWLKLAAALGPLPPDVRGLRRDEVAAAVAAADGRAGDPDVQGEP